TQRQPSLRIRLRRDQIRDSFRLDKVQPPVLHSPPRELASLGRPEARQPAQSRKQGRLYRSAAMYLKFRDILARIGMWLPKKQHNSGVNPIIRREIKHRADNRRSFS